MKKLLFIFAIVALIITNTNAFDSVKKAVSNVDTNVSNIKNVVDTVRTGAGSLVETTKKVNTVVNEVKENINVVDTVEVESVNINENPKTGAGSIVEVETEVKETTNNTENSDLAEIGDISDLEVEINPEATTKLFNNLEKLDKSDTASDDEVVDDFINFIDKGIDVK